MIINGVCNNVSVLYANTIKGVKDPSKTYFRLGLWFQGFNQAGEVPCNEEVYNAVLKVASDPDAAKKLCVVYDFDTAYNTEFHNFNIVKVSHVRKI